MRVRLLPWLLSAVTTAVVLAASSAMGAGMGGRSGVGTGEVEETLSAAPTPDPAEVDCGPLYALSEQAAVLTGSLALVDRAARPGRARAAAARIRGLAVQAASLNGGDDLAGVLETLADGLERYAGGDPAGLAAVRAASEANGRLRAAFAACCKPTQNGGEE